MEDEEPGCIRSACGTISHAWHTAFTDKENEGEMASERRIECPRAERASQPGEILISLSRAQNEYKSSCCFSYREIDRHLCDLVSFGFRERCDEVQEDKKRQRKENETLTREFPSNVRYYWVRQL